MKRVFETTHKTRTNTNFSQKMFSNMFQRISSLFRSPDSKPQEKVSSQEYHCLIDQCKHKESHSSIAHRCSNCGKYGHGPGECGSSDKIEVLKNHSHFQLKLPQDKHCKISSCRYRGSHSTESHSCQTCGKNHSIYACPDMPESEQFKKPENIVSVSEGEFNQLYEPTLKRCEKAASDIPKDKNIAFRLYAGMGCVHYVRRRSGIFESYFLHADCHGQYGEETNYIPDVNKFTQGYERVDVSAKDNFIC
jgi:hypothetical protein